MSSGVGVTVISHDSERRTLVSGYNNMGSYRRIVNYPASVAQLSRLTEISVECKQFLKYECLHSRLRTYAWWVSSDGGSRTYWGGTGNNRGRNVCACGVNVPSTCADPSKKCNCNKNDRVLRSDEGYLTWKPDLPVIELRFGDTEESKGEMGYHTLGKLKCSGLQGTVEVIRYCGGREGEGCQSYHPFSPIQFSSVYEVKLINSVLGTQFFKPVRNSFYPSSHLSFRPFCCCCNTL